VNVVDDAAHALVARLDAGAAGQRGRQQFGHHRERVALVAAERHQGTVGLGVHDVRVAGRPPLRIDERAFRRGLPLVLGDADLAHGDLAGGHVEQQRRVAVRARHRDADRVRHEPRVGAPERRDGRPVVGDVDEVHRHETRGARHLAVGADAADVMRVGEPHRHHPALAAARDGGLHRLAGDGPAIAGPPSNIRSAASSFTTFTRVFGTTRPIFRWRTYVGIMPTP
jgi:hypothetical protein